VADPAAIDDALTAKLESSNDLTTLMPDGVFFDVAPSGAKKFVLVSLVMAEDHDVFGEVAPGIQVNLYLVKAVHKSTDDTDVKAAALLIDALLQKTALAIEGYDHMVTKRVERIRATEVDDDSDVRWQHRGGRYEVWCSPGEGDLSVGTFDTGAFAGGAP
jgi:hypothetical protein